MISVFTPATVMGHSITLEQFSYVLHMIEDFSQKAPDSDFNKKLKPFLEEFVSLHQKYKVEGISPDSKNRSLSLFTDIERQDEWGENYCTTYWASFAQLAQAQRHRTLNYEIVFSSLEEEKYFVPPVIKGTKLEQEWFKDIKSLGEFYPQGRMVLVNERGTVENFILKCKERLCGCAQLEITMQTRKTLAKYLQNTKETNERVYNYLLQYTGKPRCQFPDYTCPKANCTLGPEKALDRLV